MNITLQRNPDKSISISGEIREQDILNIYCRASSEDRHKLDMLSDLVESTRRMSDYLMYISELVRVEEEIARKKVML